MTDLVARARVFAIREHRRIDHRRRYSNQPYGVHLKAVADLVAGVSDDPEAVAAAWLHDVVEDTPATHQIAGLSRRLDDWMLENAGPIVDLPR